MTVKTWRHTHSLTCKDKTAQLLRLGHEALWHIEKYKQQEQSAVTVKTTPCDTWPPIKAKQNARKRHLENVCDYV